MALLALVYQGKPTAVEYVIPYGWCARDRGTSCVYVDRSMGPHGVAARLIAGTMLLMSRSRCWWPASDLLHLLAAKRDSLALPGQLAAQLRRGTWMPRRRR